MLDHVQRLETTVVWAADEDEWEKLVSGKGAPANEVSYEREMKNAKKEPESKFYKSQKKALEVSRQMLKVVDEEKRLFEDERIQRQKEKSRLRRERKESGGSSRDLNEPPASKEPYVIFNPISGDSK